MAKVKIIKKLPTEVQSLLRSTINIYSYSQCVTELILNSLDANATSIAVRVDLINYKIQVVDNGDGILRTDLESVGKRYMTSKCKSLIDLNENLNKYGFRGEALASIVAMSESVSIVSRHKETQETFKKDFLNGAAEGKAHNGDVESSKARPSHGTTITITNFMYNLRVRQKRIDMVLDMEEIRMAIESIALIHYQVSLSLRDDSDGILVFKSHKSKSLKEAFISLLDNRVGQSIRQITISKEKYSIDIHIAKDGHISKSLQFVYINKRHVKKSIVEKVFNNLLLRKTYTMKEENNKRIDFEKTLKNNPWSRIQHNVETKKFPVFVVNLSCPYSSYDVTFLPDKSLIEFKNWDKILKMINVLIAEIVELELGMLHNDTNVEKCFVEDKKEKIDTPVDKLYLKTIVEKAFKNSHEKFGPSQLQNAIKGIPAKRKRKKSLDKDQSTLTTKRKIGTVSKMTNTNKVSDKTLDEFNRNKRRIKKISQETLNCVHYSKQTLPPLNDKLVTMTQKKSPSKSELQIFNTNEKETSLIVSEKNIDDVTKSMTLELSAKYNCNTAVKRFNDINIKLNKLESQIKAHLPVSKTNKKESISSTNIDRKNVNGHFSPKNVSKSLLKHYMIKKPFVKIKYTSSELKKYKIDKYIQANKSNQLNEIVHRTNVEYTFMVPENFHLTKKASKDNFSRTSDFAKTIIDKNSCQKLQNVVVNTKENSFYSLNKYLMEDNFLLSLDSHKNYSKTIRSISQNIIQMKKIINKKDCSVQTEFELKDFPSLNWNGLICDANVTREDYPNDKMKSILRYCKTGNTNIKSFSPSHSFDIFLNKNHKEIASERKSQIIEFRSGSSETDTQQKKIFCALCTKKLLKDDCDITQQTLKQKWDLTNNFQQSQNSNRDIDIIFRSNDSIIKETNTNNDYILCNGKFSSLQNSCLSLNNCCDKQCEHLNEEIEETNNCRNLTINDSNLIDCSIPSSNSEKFNMAKDYHDVSVESWHKIKGSNLDDYSNSHHSFSEMLEKQKKKKKSKTHVKDSYTNDSHRNMEIMRVFKSSVEKVNNSLGSSLESCFKYSMNTAEGGLDILKFSSGSKTQDSNIGQSNLSENKFLCTEIIPSGGQDPSYSSTGNKFEIRNQLVEDKNNTSHFEALPMPNCWTIKTDSFGKVIYLNDKTGMTLSDNQITDEASSYRIFKRPWFVPKGMSPILNLPDDNKVNESRKKDKLKTENKADELYKIKWIEPCFYENIYADFLSEVDKHSTICPSAVYDSSTFLGNKSTATSKTMVFDRDVLKNIKVINQVDKKFIAAIVTETDAISKYLILFDQHAVDERVRLEILLKEYREKNHKWKHVSSTNEIKIRLSSSECTSLMEHRRSFENLGLIFDYNECELNIKAFPACFATKELILDDNALNSLIVKLIRDEIEVLKTTRGTSLIPVVIYHTVSSEACRGAIKFGMSLTRHKCEKMIESLANCNVPFQCAHGRPAMIVLTNLNQFQDHKDDSEYMQRIPETDLWAPVFQRHFKG